jgi:hypothetical protein
MTDQEIEMRVEISGWDLSERFFVERGTLLDAQEEGKRATIHRPVRVGGLLFLRLLSSAHSSVAFPVAFRVREIRAELQDGTYEVTLRQMWPKPEADARGTTPRIDATRPDWLGMK